MQGQHKAYVLVFYCCITNDYKLSSLTQHIFIIPQVLWAKSWAWLSWVPCLGSYKATNLQSYKGVSPAQMDNDLLPNSFRSLIDLICFSHTTSLLAGYS